MQYSQISIISSYANRYWFVFRAEYCYNNEYLISRVGADAVLASRGFLRTNDGTERMRGDRKMQFIYHLQQPSQTNKRQI